MGPQSRLVEFNSSESSERPVRRSSWDGAGRSRVPEGALSARRAPRPVRWRSDVPGKGSGVGFGRLRVIVPGF